MIETDETGNKQMLKLVVSAATESEFWNDWELDFIEGTLKCKRYPSLTTKQKAIVTRLWDKLSEKRER